MGINRIIFLGELWKLDIEIMIYDKAHKVIQGLSKSIFYRYQTGLEELMKGSGGFLNFRLCFVVLQMS